MLWIQFASRREYEHQVQELYDILRQSDGNDQVVVYLKQERMMKQLPAARSVRIDQDLLDSLTNRYGAGNVKVVEKSIEKQR